MNKIPFAAAFAIACALLLGCSEYAVREEKIRQKYQAADRNALLKMVRAIEDINKNAPQTYSVDFYIDGISSTKRFKTQGSAQFDRKHRLMYASFLDYIFKTTVAVFLLDGDVIRLYFPMEKKLFVDNFKTISLANYSGLKIDFGVLYDLATGTIPILSNSTVKKGLVAREGQESFLILENAGYIETVSFNNGVPDKILLIDKSTRAKIEIIIKKIISEGECRFFNGLKIIAEERSLVLEMTFYRIRLNEPVKVTTIDDIKLPGKLKTQTVAPR